MYADDVNDVDNTHNGDQKYYVNEENRVVALYSFYNHAAQRAVNKGDVGGFLRDNARLSHEDTCWIFDNAIARDDTVISDRAFLSGHASISDNVRLTGNTNVQDLAEVYSDACLYGHASVTKYANVRGNVRLTDRAHVTDNASVTDDARITGGAVVRDFASVMGNARIYGNVVICDNAVVGDHAHISDHAHIGGNARIIGRTYVADHAYAHGFVTMTSGVLGDNSDVFKNEHVIVLNGYLPYLCTVSRTTDGHTVAVGCQRFTLGDINKLRARADDQEMEWRSDYDVLHDLMYARVQAWHSTDV